MRPALPSDAHRAGVTHNTSSAPSASRTLSCQTTLPTQEWPPQATPCRWPAEPPCRCPPALFCAPLPRCRRQRCRAAPERHSVATPALAAAPARTLPAPPARPPNRRHSRCPAALPQAAGCCCCACTAPCQSCCCAGLRQCGAVKLPAAAGWPGRPALARRHCWSALAPQAPGGWPAAAAKVAAAELGCHSCCRRRCCWCGVGWRIGSQVVVGQGQ